MATYREIASTEVDADSPITAPLAQAWRDNHIAVAEGAEGAPRIRGWAMDPYLGRLSDDGILTVLDLPHIGGFTAFGAITYAPFGGATATLSLQYSVSSDNGATWNSWRTIGSASDSSGSLNLSGVYMVDIIEGIYGGSGNGTVTADGSANAIRFRVLAVDGHPDGPDADVAFYATRAGENLY